MTPVLTLLRYLLLLAALLGASAHGTQKVACLGGRAGNSPFRMIS